MLISPLLLYLNFVSSVLDFVIVCPPLYVNYTLEKDTMTQT